LSWLGQWSMFDRLALFYCKYIQSSAKRYSDHPGSYAL